MVSRQKLSVAFFKRYSLQLFVWRLKCPSGAVCAIDIGTLLFSIPLLHLSSIRYRYDTAGGFKLTGFFLPQAIVPMRRSNRSPGEIIR